MRHYLIFLTALLLCLTKTHAQQQGTYITLDQMNMIEIQESNSMIIRQTTLKNGSEETIITGTFKRKWHQLILYPTSITIDVELQPLPSEIVYRIKHVTGQTFQLKRLDSNEEYLSFYLKRNLHLGIE